MNPRQRRGVLLLALAGVLGLVVFVSVANYVADVSGQVGDLTSVLRLKTDVVAYAPLTDAMVESVSVPARWAPPTAVRNTASLAGQVAGTALKRGSYLQSDMLVPRPVLAPGQRELAILIDAETGVAGKVTKGSRVDIYATFQGNGASTPPRSEIIVANARVIDVGNLREEEQPDGKGSVTQGKVVPVTFALSVQESLVLTYAESYATKVRLALVAPGDTTSVGPSDRVFTLPPPGQAVGTSSVAPATTTTKGRAGP